MEIHEDDLLFADLSKQISLLIMDDEEDESFNNCNQFPIKYRHLSLPPQGIGNHPPLQTFVQPPPPPPPMPLDYYELTGRRGTGVFIPRTAEPRRSRNRSGRPTAGHNRSSEKSRATANRLAGCDCRCSAAAPKRHSSLESSN